MSFENILNKIKSFFSKPARKRRRTARHERRLKRAKKRIDKALSPKRNNPAQPYLPSILHTEEEETQRRGRAFDTETFLRLLTLVCVSLFSLACVAYFGYHLVAMLTSEVKVSPVTAITETDYASALGYIVRDETTLTTDTAGVTDYTVTDGGRVAVGEVFCNIYLSPDASEVQQQISRLDSEIAMLKRILGAGTVVSGVLEVGNNTENDYSAVMSALCSGDIRSASELSEEFRVDLSRLSYLSGGGTDIYARLTSLTAERAEAVASLGSPAKTLKSAKAGYIFYECDGYEAVFTDKLVTTFTEEAVSEAISSYPVYTQGACGKLVSSPEWHLIAVCDGFECDDREPGDMLSVTFCDNSDTVLDMKLEKRIRTESGLILLLSCDRMPENFDFIRCQDIKIETRVYDGYRVPVSAVHSYEGMTGVFTLHGGYVYFRKTDIIAEGEGYYIVSKYEDAEPGAPKTYKVIAYGDRGIIDDYASLHEAAEDFGWERTEHNNGGIPVRYGYSYLYYYHLNSLEEIILKGENLYHGKVLG